jgi:RHS repeat-associated protein
VAVTVTLALLASLTAGPVADAQQADRPGASTDRGATPPEAFQPGSINRTPPRSDVPPGGLEGLDGATPRPESGRELPERRSENSRTFEIEEGVFQTVTYGGPVNYRDASGAWQPINSTLVPAEPPDYAFRSAAGPVSVELPAVLGSHPVKTTNGDTSVGFTLQGASATPTPGAPADVLSPTPTPEVAKASATYAGALPGVDVVYAAGAEGVKEDVVLAGPESQNSFDFSVALSPGLSARETPEGGVAVLDGAGNQRGLFNAPYMYDQSYADSGAEDGLSTEAVSLRIVAESPELVIRLTAEPAWLADPARAWPVVIDPAFTVSIQGDNTDTTLRKAAPDANYGRNEILGLKGGSDTHRILYRQSLFTEAVTVLAAEVQLYALSDTSTSTARRVFVHELSADWHSGQATWRQRRSGVAWATAGGDVRNPAVGVVDKANGPEGYRGFPMRAAVQAWVEGERPNNGVLIKYADEAAGDPIGFGSVNQLLSDYRPRMVVTFTLLGTGKPYSYEEFDLGSNRKASVHLRTGNLTIEERDVSVTGTGLDATVDRFYQSRSSGLGSVGARWRMWPQSVERLYYATHGLTYVTANNGDVKWQGGPDELRVFSRNPDGTYTSPHGYRATLSLVTEGTAQVFKLTFHETGVVYTFYGSGYLRDIVDRNANKLSFGYTCDTVANECYLASMTDTQGRVTTFERAGPNQVTKVTDPAGRVHAYTYGTTSSGNPILLSHTDPAGKVTRYEYDSGSLLARIIDANGNVTAFTYASGGRLATLKRVTDPASGAGPTWTFDHSVEGQTKVTDPRGNATTHYYDGRGRVTKVLDALGHARQSSYDSNSNVVDRTSAMGNKSIDTFDSATSNLTSSKLPTGATTTLEYTNTTFKYFPTKLTNPQGNSLHYRYDVKGNLDLVTDSMPTPGRTELAYNANGTVASSKDPKGNVTTYGYDAKGNLTKVAPPAPLGATTVAYDGLSRVTSTTDGKGQTTTYAYDALDRLTHVGFADGSAVTYRYDAGGRLVERADATGTTTYAYDRLNRVVEERLPGGRTNAYTYDAAGNLASFADVAGTVSYGYNPVNLVTTLVEPGGATTTFAYDDDDNRTTTTYPNGVTQSATYDGSDRLTSIAGTKGSTTLARFSYTYTKPGTTADTALRHTVKDKANATTTYTYDALDRLTRALTKNSLGLTTVDYTYDYDAAGNRFREGVSDGLLGLLKKTTESKFNAANQLTARGNVSYSYDANGNQTGSSEGQALVYNGADQTTSLKKPGGSALSATYAGTGQTERASAGATSFTNGLLGLTAATTASATQATTRDPAGNLVGLRDGTSRSYFLFDGLGSVVAVTNASGSVTNSYTYDPYGVTTETTSSGAVANPWRYTGQYQDASTGLYKIGARYYQPELGRWTQPDPSGLEPNAYAYVRSNPANFVDPSGLLTFSDVVTGVAGAVTGIIAGSAGTAFGGPLGGAIAGCLGTGAGAALGRLATGEDVTFDEEALACLGGAVAGPFSKAP